MMAKLLALKLDIEELKKLQTSSSRASVQNLLDVEIQKLETELHQLEAANLNSASMDDPWGAAGQCETSEKTPLEGVGSVESGQEKLVQKKSTTPTAPKCYDVKLNNYAWDQSDRFVKIFVTLKDVQTLPKEKVNCNFQKRSVEMLVWGLSGRNYSLPITNLLEEIDPCKSYWKVKTDMVVVFLAKKKASQWSHMTGQEKKSKEAKTPKYDPKMEDDPSAGLMNLLKQMYEDGDDEMKRTIAKAWTESRDKQMPPGQLDMPNSNI